MVSIEDKLVLAGECAKRAEFIYSRLTPLTLRIVKDEDFLLDCNDLFKDYVACCDRVSSKNVVLITDLYKKVLHYASCLEDAGLICSEEINLLLSYSGMILEVFKNDASSIDSSLSLVISKLKK